MVNHPVDWRTLSVLPYFLGNHYLLVQEYLLMVSALLD